jgi:hypothetical protein
MTAMFPGSGVPWSDAKNSLQDPATVYCDELWYSTNRCTPRFDPAAANAVLSELINVVNRGEVTYDCRYLDQVQLAIRYIVQRGLPRAAYLSGGPNAYTGPLDPPVTRYNNFMTLTVVPATTNIGPVTYDAGLGAAYVLRSDGNHLERQDWKAGVPYIISFINGYWYMCSLANSQVPLLVKGGIDCWIRTDGNDTLGDGTSNDPQHAFKTIAGAWNAVGSRYASTPLFSINMKFGIPGTYDGTIIGPFGGSVSLTGDPNNPAAYRIANFYAHPLMYPSLWVQAIAGMYITGVTFLCNTAAPNSCPALRCISANVSTVNCRWEVLTPNPNGCCIDIQHGGKWSTSKGINTWVGNGLQIGSIWYCYDLSSIVGAYLNPGERSDYYIDNFSVSQASLICNHLSTMSWSQSANNINNAIGRQHIVDMNSVCSMNGRAPIGNVAGIVANGAQFTA